VPVPIGQKRPIIAGWEKLRLGADDLPLYFTEVSNIGLILGEPLVDVDLDVIEAVKLAPTLLPPTGMISGRPGKPRSHWWYRATPTGGHTKQFKLDKETMLVELRSLGGQTIVPPSLHPSDERYEWNDFGEPAVIERDLLLRQVQRVAAGALLARSWPREEAQDFVRALWHELAASGWAREDAANFVRAVAQVAGDADSAKRVESSPPPPGADATDLDAHIEPRVLRRVRDWLELRGHENAARSRARGSSFGSAVRDGADDPEGERVNGSATSFGTEGDGTGSPLERLKIVLGELPAGEKTWRYVGSLARKNEIADQVRPLAADPNAFDDGAAMFERRESCPTPTSDEALLKRLRRALVAMARPAEPDKADEKPRILVQNLVRRPSADGRTARFDFEVVTARDGVKLVGLDEKEALSYERVRVRALARGLPLPILKNAAVAWTKALASAMTEERVEECGPDEETSGAIALAIKQALRAAERGLTVEDLDEGKTVVCGAEVHISGKWLLSEIRRALPDEHFERTDVADAARGLGYRPTKPRLKKAMGSEEEVQRRAWTFPADLVAGSEGDL